MVDCGKIDGVCPLMCGLLYFIGIFTGILKNNNERKNSLFSLQLTLTSALVL